MTANEPLDSARSAGLRYVTDDRPGIRRVKGRGGFRYLSPDGRPLTDGDEIARIRSLAVASSTVTTRSGAKYATTMSCALALAAVRVGSQSEAKAAILEVVKIVALRLGNTPAVCRKSYIFPPVIEEFLSSGGLTLIEKRAAKKLASVHAGLAGHERDVVGFIERIVTRDEHARVSDLLAKSVRATAKAKAATRTSPRGRRVRGS